MRELPDSAHGSGGDNGAGSAGPHPGHGLIGELDIPAAAA